MIKDLPYIKIINNIFNFLVMSELKSSFWLGWYILKHYKAENPMFSSPCVWFPVKLFTLKIWYYHRLLRFKMRLGRLCFKFVRFVLHYFILFIVISKPATPINWNQRLLPISRTLKDTLLQGFYWPPPFSFYVYYDWKTMLLHCWCLDTDKDFHNLWKIRVSSALS